MKRSFFIFILVLLIFITGCTEQIDKIDDIKTIPEEIIEEVEVPEAITVTIPTAIENNCFGFLTGAPREVKTISLMKMSWSRPHIGPFVWDHIERDKGEFYFDETDLWVRKAQKNKIATLATIWPYAKWDQEDCHSTECYVSSQDTFSFDLPKSRCVPCNMESYKNFLIKLVNRYDGDGMNDMPGLELPIKYWEILNEPEMNDPKLTFYKGTPEEYVQILKSSKEAIKSTCSDCMIVQGGAAGIDKYMLDYWKKIFDLGGADYFDIANIHYIDFGDLTTLNVKEFKKLMDTKGVSKPIWVTEAEYHQKGEVAASVRGALNAGADKIFFTRFVVGQTGPPIPGKYSPVYNEVIESCDN